jgi:hypothetical protein
MSAPPRLALDQVVLRATPDRLVAEVRVVRSRQHHQRQRRGVVHDRLHRVQPIAVGQAEVAQHDIERFRRKLCQRVRQPLDAGNRELARGLFGERGLHQQRIAGIVLDQQYAQGRHGAIHPAIPWAR